MKNLVDLSRPSSNLVDRYVGWLPLSVVTGVVVGILVGTALPASAATATNSSRRVTFGIEPASVNGADGRPNFSFGVTPGATLFDHVALVNYSTIPLSLQLYATDAVETSEGGFGLLPAAVRPTAVGSWITLPAGTSTVQVPAESGKSPGQVVIPFTVQTPIGAPPGDHVGGIIASLQTTGLNKSGQKVVLDQRIGTRVYLRVSGPLNPNVVLRDSKASYLGTLNPIGQGRVKVSYVVSNTGNVNLSLVDQSVSVSGLFGSKWRVGLPTIPLLLPGSSVPESVVVNGVWPEFLLHVTETADPRTLPGSTVPGLAAVTSTTSVWAIPWVLLVIIVLIALALFLLLRARSRRRAVRPDAHARRARR
jgi:hypothetical protein